MKIFIKVLLFSLVIAGFFFIFDNNKATFDTLLNINPVVLVLLLATDCLFLLLFVYFQKIIFQIFELQQTSAEWIGLAIIASFYNLFLPAKGGSVLRSVYLKKKYNFPYKKFLAYLIKQTIYILIVVSFIAGTLLLIVSKGVALRGFTVVLGCFTIVFSISVYFFEKKLVAWLSKRKKIDDNFIASKKYFWRIVLVLSLSVVVKGVAFYLVFAAINYPVSLDHSLLIASLVMLSNIVSVLPGNIGIRELLMGGVLQMFGYDLPFVLLASLVDRAAVIMITTLGTIVFKYILSKEFKLYE